MLDVWQLKYFAKFLTFSFEMFNNNKYEFETVFKKFKQSLKEEIDFLKEAQNSQ